jgi:hypothetical protein
MRVAGSEAEGNVSKYYAGMLASYMNRMVPALSTWLSLVFSYGAAAQCTNGTAAVLTAQYNMRVTVQIPTRRA